MFGRARKIQLNHMSGFSLVELMIVVAIIGILAALAQPQFLVYQARAKQSEAMTNLSMIYALANGAASEHANGLFPASPADTRLTLGDNSTDNSCARTNELGFRLTECRETRYVYFYEQPTVAGDITFVAQAEEFDNRVFPSCTGFSDAVLIDQNKFVDQGNVDRDTVAQTVKGNFDTTSGIVVCNP
jgi:prepilin-type N-terminal cleavage/methylation domain-containing protein